MRLMGELDSGDLAPTEPMRDAYQNNALTLATVLTAWNDLQAKELVAFNAVLTKNNLKPIAAASALPMGDLPKPKPQPKEKEAKEKKDNN